ncbi:MAG: 50S ribosomal protein L20, partial [Patescibacteria group bacterium]|nr:50S ribosomal protein L20 [Patescibacteria group bacterium]
GIVSRRKHKKLLAGTKGYRGTKSNLVKVAKEANLHAGAYSYHGRKLRKRNMRRLFITRIAEAVKQEGMPYRVFINKLKKEKIELNRKILNYLATEDTPTFKQLVKKVNKT